MTCYDVDVDGVTHRVHGEPTDNPETLEAIRGVIRAARKKAAEHSTGHPDTTTFTVEEEGLTAVITHETSNFFRIHQPADHEIAVRSRIWGRHHAENLAREALLKTAKIRQEHQP